MFFHLFSGVFVLNRVDKAFGSSDGRLAAASPRTPMFSEFQSFGCGPASRLFASICQFEQGWGVLFGWFLRRAGGGLPPVHGPQCFGMFVVFDCGIYRA